MCANYTANKRTEHAKQTIERRSRRDSSTANYNFFEIHEYSYYCGKEMSLYLDNKCCSFYSRNYDIILEGMN